MFALSTEVTWPRRDGEAAMSNASSAMRSISSVGVDARVVRDAVAAAAVAEVDPAGQLAHDHQVRAARRAPRAAGWRPRAPARPAPGAGSRTARGPCAGRAGPAPGAGRRGRSCPTSARPTAPSSTASAPRQRSSTSGSSGVPCSSIETPPTGSCSTSKPASNARRERVQQLERRPDHLGADAVARQGDDLERAAAMARLRPRPPGPSRPGRRGRSAR